MNQIFALLALFSASLALADGAAPMIEVGSARPAKPTIVIAPSVIRTALDNASTYQVGNDTYLVIDVLAGSHIGLRGAIPTINFTDNARLELEGYYGGAVTRMGFVEFAGGGMRVQLNLTQDQRGKNALFISPAVDFYVAWDNDPTDGGLIDFGPDSNVYLLGANVDVKWVHEFARHFGLQIGLHIGGDVSLGGINNRGEETRGMWTPELSLFAGLRF